MALGVAMSTAVFAIRRTAAGIDCIARRRGWGVEYAVNSRGWLAISVLVPPAQPTEWEDLPRTGAGLVVPPTKLPPPVGRVVEACTNVLSNRGLEGRARTLVRTSGEREVWTLELTFPAPDERRQRNLRNHR